MENQNIEFRAVLQLLTKKGTNAKEIHRCMTDVYGDSSPKYSSGSVQCQSRRLSHSSHNLR